MDAQQALADLTEISSQIRAAVLIDDKGAVAASTLGGEQAARMAKAAGELLSVAERTRPGLGPGTLTQLEVATLEGSVFVVRDHGRVIAATTSPEPTVGLVFYDLKSCLRSADGEKPKAPAAKPAAKRPVRASGPGEGARGNREVPPTSTEAVEKPENDAKAAKPARKRAPKKDADGAA